MVHQQGIQGAIEHYTHPERVAWRLWQKLSPSLRNERPICGRPNMTCFDPDQSRSCGRALFGRGAQFPAGAP
jgi:hypothetical protein